MPSNRMIRKLCKLLLIVIVSLPFLVLLFALQTERAIPPGGNLSPPELAQVEQLMLDSAPDSTTEVSRALLNLGEADLNLLLRYGLQLLDLSPAWSGQAELRDGLLELQTSIAIFGSASPPFLNVTAELQAVNAKLQITGLRIGRLVLPAALQRLALSRLRNNLLSRNSVFNELQELAANTETLGVSADELKLEISWQPDLIYRIASRTRQLFVPEADRQRIIAYYEEIRSIKDTVPADTPAVSLNAYLVPLFRYAHEQSLTGSDPVAENRALFQALAIYVNNENLQQFSGVGESDGEEIEPVQFVEVRLLRRQDLAQHLTSTAATTASSGAGFAQLLSTAKEAYDARHRSGFSFSDLTANSVGVALASHATRDHESAMELQRRIGAVANESDYMPTGGSNRDGLSEADFARIYRDRNSPEYQQRIAEIELLIAERPLFAGLSPINPDQ